MDQNTKQRIVGSVVILVAAVVLLPVLFDGQGSYDMPLESRIPAPVLFPEPPRIVPERPVVIADTDQIRVAAVASPEPIVVATVTEPVATPAVEAPKLDSTGLPEGWSVRLGSFSRAANAKSLVERLQARGHRAYMREVRTEQGALTAVFVGPGVDRAVMQQLQRQLLDEFELSGIVVRYEIESL
ncbi:MAG: SPOR domain-containing protein [Gammaproteobacteria bacterium]|nr:SPOR domain-containing protein [Gammaproteobacteria bacterium]